MQIENAFRNVQRTDSSIALGEAVDYLAREVKVAGRRICWSMHFLLIDAIFDRCAILPLLNALFPKGIAPPGREIQSPYRLYGGV